MSLLDQVVCPLNYKAPALGKNSLRRTSRLAKDLDGMKQGRDLVTAMFSIHTRTDCKAGALDALLSNRASKRELDVRAIDLLKLCTSMQFSYIDLRLVGRASLGKRLVTRGQHRIKHVSQEQISYNRREMKMRHNLMQQLEEGLVEIHCI